MRRTIVQQAGVGVSGPVIIDDSVGASMLTTLAINIDSGLIDATAEYTVENMAAGTPVDALWYPHRFLTNCTAKAAGTIVAAVSAVRLRNVAAGTARMVVLQANADGPS